MYKHKNNIKLISYDTKYSKKMEIKYHRDNLNILKIIPKKIIRMEKIFILKQ